LPKSADLVAEPSRKGGLADPPLLYSVLRGCPARELFPAGCSVGHRGAYVNAADARRRGFTLVELLVVIAIIGTLVGLLLPAVQVARESARRSTCQNRVKQLVLGVLNRVDAQGTFPMGAQTWLDNAGPTIGGITYGNRRWSWFVYVLPFVEEQSMYDAQWRHYSSSNWQSSAPATGLSYVSLPQKSTAVAGFICPSDPTNPKLNSQDGPASGNNQGFHGNYVLSAGNQTYGTTSAGTAQLNGLSFPLSAVKIKDVTDGLSKTVAVSEIMLIPEPVGGGGSAVDTRGRYHNNMHGGCNFSTLNQPNTTVNDRLPYCSNAVATAPCQGGSGANHVIAARSYHSGGVNAAMADGGVRFVTNEISVQVWQAVGSRSGGGAGQCS
jgi:prepilin-type N-terminal cleavage/methylation domain-containing protein/prepilin-type processing-associated H-X9-DG protein